MPDTIIHTIPDAYYGGAVPKKVPHKEAPEIGLIPGKPTKTPRKISPKVLFISAVSILFVAVVGGSVWYFTRGLREAPAVPTPAPEVTPTPPAVEVPPPAPEIPELPPALPPVAPPTLPAQPTAMQDTDSDGLSDLEENLYGSQSSVPDTDNDGFLDGHEVFNLYNPSGIAPERLEAAGFAVRFISSTYRYEILYPKPWTIAGDIASREVIFQSATGESILVSVIDNPENTTARAYAASNFQSAEISDWTTNKAGLPGIFAKEGATLRGVFAGQGFIYVVLYGTAVEGAYKRTFEMMLNSVRIMN